jgi:hypothetical protein
MASGWTTCYWVQCDNVGCPDLGWDEGTPHFETMAEALATARGEGWQEMPDGQLLCRRCAEERDCQVTGHQMSGWGLYGDEPDVVWRVCRHCGGAFEKRAARDVEA